MMLQERILRNFEFPHFVIHSAKGSKTFWHYELQNGETQIRNSLTIPVNWNIIYLVSAGWSSLEARRAHNPKAAGSNPAPAIF